MVDHIILTVSNFAQAVAFYEAVLPHVNILERQDYDGKDGPPGHPDLKVLERMAGYSFGCGKAYPIPMQCTWASLRIRKRRYRPLIAPL